MKGNPKLILWKGDWLFQLVLGLIAFYFYVVDNDKGRITFAVEPYHFVFFLNFFWVHLVISYVLLPRYFYKNKYLLFSLYTVLTFLPMVLMEEIVLEQIFFPDTREPDWYGAMLSFIQALPILTILVGLKLAKDAGQRQEELNELRILIKESELNQLNAQINPHFLFNNLNNLYGHAVEQSGKTPALILGLSSILRYMLYECKEPTVSLSKEIDHLRNLIELQKLHIEGRGQIHFDCNVTGEQFRIAPFVLNVFVENAFKHSQLGLSEDIKIEIALHVNEANQLHFQCKNNFEWTPNHEVKKKGIGLINVRKRLDLLYPNQHSLHISEHKNQYQVSLKLPLYKA